MLSKEKQRFVGGWVTV